jgi:hypothetical protein
LKFFLTNLELVLQKLFFLKFTFIIFGDININYLADNYKKKQLDSILHSFNLSTIVNFPTRIGLSSLSTIDNVFIDKSYLNKYNITPVINSLSDNDAQLLTIQTFQKHINNQQVYYKRDINQFTIAELPLKLSYETWESVFTNNDVNEMYNSFLNTFLRYYHSCFPMIKTNKLPYGKPWITAGIRTSRKHKRELYMEYRKYKYPTQTRFRKDYCRISSKVIKEAKKMEYDRRILNSTTRMKSSWNLINTERGKGMNSQIIQLLNVDGETIADHQTIADTFNKHFITILDTINKKNTDKNYSAETYRNNQNSYHHLLSNAFQTSLSSMKFTCTTGKEINSIIKSLKPSNSSGYDEITTFILKDCFLTSPLR